MIKEISSNFSGGNIIELRTASDFKLGATFKNNADYIVIQNKKVLGFTEKNGNLTTSNAKLDASCFPGLVSKGFLFKKVNAGIWCLKKEFQFAFTVNKKYNGIDVYKKLNVKVTLNDTMRAWNYMQSVTNDLWFSSKRFENMVPQLADIYLDAVTKVIVNKGGKAFGANHLSLVSKNIKNDLYETGYSVDVEDLVGKVLSEMKW